VLKELGFVKEQELQQALQAQRDGSEEFEFSDLDDNV